MTLNLTAASLIRHNHARPVKIAEALDLLQTAYDHHLIQFGENVRQKVNFICHCCKCCCVGMQAARRFALQHPVHSTCFLPQVDSQACTGCGKCVPHCPVEAVRLEPLAKAKKKRILRAKIDPEICLGCGICARNCPQGAIALQRRPQRIVTPLNTAHRVVLMAVERNCLQHIVFDNQVLFSHRALATLLGAIFKLPPAKQLLASRQLKSRYLETIVTQLHWQP
jgi:Pyruvate/2-oxoacid:ferredoxin oxidoreductase delta subunit